MNEKIIPVGKVFLVGSGPGGLSMMTIRARDVIDTADVILYIIVIGGVVSLYDPDAERVVRS